jgi:hypothetical protein
LHYVQIDRGNCARRKPWQETPEIWQTCQAGEWQAVRNQGVTIMRAKASVWAGRAMSAMFALFILGASAAPKLMGMPIADEVMNELGWPPGYVLPIGVLELTLVLLYLYPRTSVLGAVLFMGLLGGAMATQVRAGSPLLSHQLFSIYLGLLMWGGLWLRDGKLRNFLPWRRTVAH